MAKTAAALVLLALGAAGCAQPGTRLAKQQAAKMTTGTGDIATACGYAIQGSAFPHQHPRLAHLESMARQGAVELADVFNHDHDQSDIYEGETVSAIVGRSMTLLRQCGLHEASAPLRTAVAHGK